MSDNQVSSRPSPGSLSAMETRVGTRPGSRVSLGLWLLITAHALQHARAEISCGSCPSPVQLHREELQLAPGLRSDPAEEAVAVREARVTGRESGMLATSGPNFSLDEVKPAGSESGVAEDAAPWRAKRSAPDFSEFSDSDWTGRTAQLDSHKAGRSEFGWNRQDERGNTRQDEPRLNSSTFALTGDSAHNHAVVYWTGQNSSVSSVPFLSVRINSSQRTLCAAVNRCTSSYRCALTHAARPEQHRDLRAPNLSATSSTSYFLSSTIDSAAFFARSLSAGGLKGAIRLNILF